MGKEGLGQKTILSTVGLKKHFGEVKAVDGVDIDIFKGEILSIIGTNGAGKTTLLKLLSGGLSIGEGIVTFMGMNINHLSLVQRVRMGIIYSFQIPLLFENLTVEDNIRLPLLIEKHKTLNFFRKTDKYSEVQEEAWKILNMFNVPENHFARELPHGQRKLLDSAIAFAIKPKLLLLDEPTSGVSTNEKAQVMDTIMPNIRQTQTTTVIVEHDMEIVTRYSERVVVMNQGKIFAQGPPDVVMGDKEVKRILLGL